MGELIPFHNTEEYLIYVAACVVRQADNMPSWILKWHSEYLDYCLENFPEQAHAVLDFLSKYEPGEWIEDE